MLGKMVIDLIKGKKKEIVDELNGLINVPLVSEKKEEACINSIFDAVVDVLEKILTKEK